MARGEIKTVVSAIFMEYAPKRIAGEMDNKTFRTTVCNQLMAYFEGMSLKTAKTHYNNVKQQLEEENSPLVQGLGRDPDKRGGRPVGRKSAQFSVRRVEDGVIIVSNLKRAVAEAMIAEAEKQKTAKLELVP